MHRFRDPVVWAGVVLAIGSFVVYWLSNRAVRRRPRRPLLPRRRVPPRPHRIGLDAGPFDVITVQRPHVRPVRAVPGDRPAAARGAHRTRGRGPVGIGINALLRLDRRPDWPGGCSGRIGASPVATGSRLALLLGFCTQIWWVTTRGGVWHTGHLIATILTLLLIAELFGGSARVLMGLLVGAAFLTRAPARVRDPGRRPVAGAVGHVRGRADGRHRQPDRGPPVARLGVAGVGLLPSLAFFFWYNADRFGSPLRVRLRAGHPADVARGAARAGPVLASHVGDEPRLPAVEAAGAHRRSSRTSGPTAWACRCSFTSPGLLLAVRAPWRDRRSWLLLGGAIAGPDPDAALLRRRLAAVRLPLLPRLDPVRRGRWSPWASPSADPSRGGAGR